MAKGRQMGAPTRTTRIPIRGVKLDKADHLLAMSREAEAVFEALNHDFAATARFRLIRRRHIHGARYRALVRYHQAVRAAQDLAHNR